MAAIRYCNRLSGVDHALRLVRILMNVQRALQLHQTSHHCYCNYNFREKLQLVHFTDNSKLAHRRAGFMRFVATHAEMIA